MRRCERATRLASQRCSSRPIQPALGYSRHFHASALVRADNESSKNDGSSGSTPPPRTNKARIEEAYRQISRLREARSKAEAPQDASEKAARTTQSPVNQRVLVRRAGPQQGAERPSRSRGDIAANQTDGDAGLEGGRGKRSQQRGNRAQGRRSNAPDFRGGTRRDKKTPGKRGGALERDASQKLVVNEYDEFDEDEDEDDEDDEDGQWMQGRPEDIMEEAGDDHFGSEIEQDYYADILHKMRDLERNLAVAEETRTAAEQENDPKQQREAEEMENLIDASIEEIMGDLAQADKVGAPPHPIKPFDVSEFRGMRGGIPTGTSGMGNVVEDTLRYLADREDGEYRDPMKLGQRLVDGQFNHYNTLVEKNEAHIRAGHLRPQEEETARKERNLANKLDHTALIRLFVRRRGRHRQLRKIQRALDEADDDMPQEELGKFHAARKDIEQKITDLSAQITAGRGETSRYTGSGLSVQQRRELVQRLVQGRYQDPADMRLQHPALQNVARIIGTNASYRPDAKARVLDTLRSMMPSEKANIPREPRRS